MVRLKCLLAHTHTQKGASTFILFGSFQGHWWFVLGGPDYNCTTTTSPLHFLSSFACIVFYCGWYVQKLKTKLFVHLSMKKKKTSANSRLPVIPVFTCESRRWTRCFPSSETRLHFLCVMWACFWIYLQMLNYRLSISLI